MTRFSLRPLTLVAALSPVCVHAADISPIVVEGGKRVSYETADSLINIIPDGSGDYFPITYKDSDELFPGFERPGGSVYIHQPANGPESAIGTDPGTFLNLHIGNGSLDVAISGEAVDGTGVIHSDFDRWRSQDCL